MNSKNRGTTTRNCTIQDAIRELAENDQVAHIEPNYELYPCGDTIEMEIK